MKLIAGDALALVEQEDCPEEINSSDLQVGMQIEHVLELQDLVKLFQQEYVRLKRIVTGLLSSAAEKSPTSASVIGSSEVLNHKTSCNVTAGWYNSDEVSAALLSWRQRSFLSDRGEKCCLSVSK